MQKFNYDLYKKGREVRTRDGRKVSNLYYIDAPGLLYPIIGVIEGSDYVESWQADGTFAVDWKSAVDEHNLDLFILDYPDEMTTRSHIAFNAGYWLSHMSNLLACAHELTPSELRKLHHKTKWTMNYVSENIVYREIRYDEVNAEYEKAHGILTLTDEC